MQQIVKLSAVAFSVKPGGSAREVTVEGGLTTHGVAVNPLELHGAVESFQVIGGFAATGSGFDKI